MADFDIKQLAEGLLVEDYAREQAKLIEARIKDQELALAYNTVMKSADGKRVVWDLLSFCGVFQLSMTGNSYTYFNEGKRGVGLYLLTMLKLGTAIEDIEKIEKINKGKING